MILQASNLSLTDGQRTMRLVADVALGSSTLTVDNIIDVTNNQWLLIQDFGDSSAEIIKVHGTTDPTGSTITLATNTVKDHYTDAKVSFIDYNQVEFSRATTLTGSKSVLTTKNIAADKLDTTYSDVVNTTGYAFFRFYNNDPTSYAFSQYSSGINYTGLDNSSVQRMVDKACRDTGVVIGGDFSTEEMLLDDANDCQDAITDFDWKFELVKNDTSLAASQYENTYALSGLTYELKYPGIIQGIKSVKLAGKRLEYVDNDVMDGLLSSVKRTTVATQAEIGATSIVLTNTAELPSAGTIFINGLSIIYTANNETTNTLSGIPVGVITAILPVGSLTWYNINPGLATKYTITIDNNIVLNCPIDVTYNGYSFTFEYLKKLTRFTDFASVTEIPFSDSMPDYIKAKIEQRKRNFENYDKFMAVFDKAIQAKLDFYKLPIFEDSRYYNFFDTGAARSAGADWFDR